MAATSLVLAVALFSRSASEPVVEYRDRLVYAPAKTPSPSDLTVWAPMTSEPLPISGTLPKSAPPQPVLSRNNYLIAREVALRMGVDALETPAYRSGPTASPTHHDLLEVFAPAEKEASSLFDLFPGL
jgi:hypothetical protein